MGHDDGRVGCETGDSPGSCPCQKTGSPTH